MFARIKKAFWKTKVQACVAARLVAAGFTTKEARDGSVKIVMAFDVIIEGCYCYDDPFGGVYTAEDTAELVWEIFVNDGMPAIEGELA